ncbi:hypothetical protein RCO48_23695 [Peribacillus frigoritolerans]|nr:hypothetical protein [Peribacillus frigoritolerans]
MEKLVKTEKHLLFIKKQLEEGLGVGVSSISEQEGKFAWYDPDQDVLVKNDKVKKVFLPDQLGNNNTIRKGFYNLHWIK